MANPLQCATRLLVKIEDARKCSGFAATAFHFDAGKRG
jgi:hypothetical protein